MCGWGLPPNSKIMMVSLWGVDCKRSDTQLDVGFSSFLLAYGGAFRYPMTLGGIASSFAEGKRTSDECQWNVTSMTTAWHHVTGTTGNPRKFDFHYCEWFITKERQTKSDWLSALCLASSSSCPTRTAQLEHLLGALGELSPVCETAHLTFQDDRYELSIDSASCGYGKISAEKGVHASLDEPHRLLSALWSELGFSVLMEIRGLDLPSLWACQTGRKTCRNSSTRCLRKQLSFNGDLEWLDVPQ